MDLVAALRRLVSEPGRVTDDEAVARSHGHDISHHAQRPPDAVVFPDSVAEVESSLRWADEERVPVTPYGSGTSVEGHVIPVHGGISLDLGARGSRGGRRAETLARAEGCIAFDAGSDESERVRLWNARHNAAFAVLATAPGKKLMSTDVCVPVSTLPDAIRHARQVVDSAGVVGAILGHVGDGNSHTISMVDPDDASEIARRAVNAEIVRHALALGGTCTGEHGIGLRKRSYLREEGGAAVDVMRAIKRTLDPHGILNPGKVLG